MKFICPLIVVEDITRSRTFYEEFLGLTVEFDFGENIQFHGPFSIHQRDHYQKLLSLETDKEIKFKSNNMELYFESEELESLSSRVTASNIELIHDIVEQPWGQRDLRFYDPDGHIIEVGESMDRVILRFFRDGMDALMTSHKTSMPLEYIEKLLRRNQDFL